MPTPAENLEVIAAAGYDEVEHLDVYEAIGDETNERPTGPGGKPVPSKHEKAVALKAVTSAEVTAANPPEYSDDELQHRFTNVAPEGYKEPVFPHPQV